jgi:beta-lactamase regulating signal transducer with metallopeptidase domain
MALLAFALSYIAVLFIFSPWIVKRWLGNGVRPRTGALVHFSSILIYAVVSLVFMGVLLYVFAAGALLDSLEHTCRQVMEASRDYLSTSSWSLPLMLIIGVFIILQAGFLLGGGIKMLLASRRASKLRKRASMACPALRSITGNRWASNVCLILSSPDTVEAETAGIFRPRIYFSEGLVQMFSSQQLIAVVTHEEAHRSHKDNVLAVVAKTIATTLFYLPGPRTSYREMHTYLEKAADLRAVAVAGSSLTVADTLAKIAVLAPDSNGTPVSYVKAGKGDLKNRLEALVKTKESFTRRRFRIFLITVTAIISLAIFSAGALAVTGPETKAAFLCYFKHEHAEDGRCLSKDDHMTPESVCNHFLRP